MTRGIGGEVWELEGGEGESEDVWRRGTLRVVLLVLEVSVSVSWALSVSEEFFPRDASLAISLATASLM